MAKTSSRRPIRAFQWDLARQVERLDVLLELLPKYADWGYTELYLHLEDAVEYPSFPDVARPDAYRHRDLLKLVGAARRVGIGVVPIVNLLGHTQYLIKTPDLRDLNELRNEQDRPLEKGQLCPLHPRTLGVAEALINDVLPFCTAGKLHVGLDESFHLGKCPRCREQIEKHGLAYHFSTYVKQLHAIVAARELRLGLWADMLNFIPEAIPQLPKGIIAYDWYYYAFKRHPRVELYNFAEIDLVPALKAQGIEYWGCPMNGAFRYEPLPLFKDRLANLRSWWRRCQEVKAGGFLVTSWEAYRLAFPLTTVVDAAAASLWKNRKKSDGDRSLLAQGYARAFGRRDAENAARISLAADEYPFAGYAQWELNDRWDIRAGVGQPRNEKKALVALRKLERRAARAPVALSASLGLRVYLEARAVFVQTTAEAIFAVRTLLRKKDSTRALRTLTTLSEQAASFAEDLALGLKAARTMWLQSRAGNVLSQNEKILSQDQRRLAELKKWLQTCREDPRNAFATNPVCGAWHLVFDVINREPAVQRVLVEQKQANGVWLEIRARHTIEFQAKATAPRAKISRSFSVPLETTAPLRLALHGVGRVEIARLKLTNGPETLYFKMDGFMLGKIAPSSGFPDIFAVTDIKLLVRKPKGSAADLK